MEIREKPNQLTKRTAKLNPSRTPISTSNANLTKQTTNTLANDYLRSVLMHQSIGYYEHRDVIGSITWKLQGICVGSLSGRHVCLQNFSVRSIFDSTCKPISSPL